MNEINELLKYGESEKAEFKKSTAQLEKGLKAVCGFLNHRGGSVYFGIHGGKVVGQEVSDSTLRSISQKIRQKIKPEMSPEIKVLDTGGMKFIEVEVKEGKNKLYYLDGIAYKRVGTENVVIPPDELERIILEKKGVHFDSEICEEASLNDIDMNFVREFFVLRYEKYAEKEVVGSHINLLGALGCIKEDMPTNAGIILFGKTPQDFFRNAYIALARYGGKEIGIERMDYKEFKGNLFRQIDECDRYIKGHITMMGRLLPYQVERQDIPEYPWFSIRELVVNAAAHRDYMVTGSKVIIKMFDDRIEYYNPGGLLPGITPDNIVSKQHSRNEIIADVLSRVRYIEGVGEGWDKIIKEHKQHPLKPLQPKITTDDYTTEVKIFSTKEKFESEKKVMEQVKLSEKQLKVLMYLQNTGAITRTECEKLLNVPARTANRELTRLIDYALIQKKSIGRKTYYTLSRQKWQEKMARNQKQ